MIQRPRNTPPDVPRSATPAPVITHEGVYGTPPPRFVPARHSEARAWLGLACVFAVTLWLAAFSLVQITALGVATPTHQRTVAAIAEADRWIGLHALRLCSTATSNSPGDTANLDGFPVYGIVIRNTEVPCASDGLDRTAFRDLLLTRAAELVYLRGAAAFTKDERTPDAASLLTGTGLTRLLLDTVTVNTHDWATIPAYALTALVLLLAVLILLSGDQRLRRLGASILIGALPVIGSVLALRLLLGLLGPDPIPDPMLHELTEVVRSLVWLPARNAVIVAVAGLALILPTLLRRH